MAKYEEMTIAQLVAEYNEMVEILERPGDKVKTFRDKTVALKRVKGVDVEVNAMRAVEAPKAKKSGEVRTKAPVVNTDLPRVKGEGVIKVTAKVNPRDGAAALRFDLYRDGMTVDEYCAAVVAKKLSDRRLAIRDVAWNAARGWISVSYKG